MAYNEHQDKRAHVHSLSQISAVSNASFDQGTRKEFMFFSAQRIHSGIQFYYEPFHGYDGEIFTFATYKLQIRKSVINFANGKR